MRRVEAIAEKNPRLLEKIDSGEMSIHAAFQQTVQDSDAESGKKVFMEPLSETPQRVKHTATDPVFRAGHERLMKNPLYMNLRAQLKEAEYEANRAKSKLERETEFYANQVKHFTSNIDALKVQCNQLRVENTALRAQLASISAEGENHEQ